MNGSTSNYMHGISYYNNSIKSALQGMVQCPLCKNDPSASQLVTVLLCGGYPFIQELITSLMPTFMNVAITRSNIEHPLVLIDNH